MMVEAWLVTGREPKATAFIQWKGTDVCCDFTCTCGHQAHIDAGFMYYVRCPECGSIWESPQHVTFTQVHDTDCSDGCVVDAMGWDDG